MAKINSNQDQNKTHTTAQLVFLHLLPGVLVGSFYFLIRQPIQNLGYPSVFALMLAIAFVLLPFELGFLLYQGKRRTGRYTLDGILSYRQSIPWWQYLVWVVIVFVAIGAIFALLQPVASVLQEKVFAWVPTLESGLDGEYSKTALIVTYAAVFVFGAILGPVVEELYFRGYLLPHMKGNMAPLVHSFLFAVYHVFSPWMVITRTIGMLPLVYAVQKKNIYIGMIVHVLVNSLDVVTGIAFISGMA